MSEFHDLAELALNREGQSWGNLGYWVTATGYLEACRALTKMGDFAPESGWHVVAFLGTRI